MITNKEINKLIEGVTSDPFRFEYNYDSPDLMICKFCGESININSDDSIKHDENCVYILALQLSNKVDEV